MALTHQSFLTCHSSQEQHRWANHARICPRGDNGLHLITGEVRGQDSRSGRSVRRWRLALRAGMEMGMPLHPRFACAQTEMRRPWAQSPIATGCTPRAKLATKANYKCQNLYPAMSELQGSGMHGTHTDWRLCIHRTPFSSFDRIRACECALAMFWTCALRPSTCSARWALRRCRSATSASICAGVGLGLGLGL